MVRILKKMFPNRNCGSFEESFGLIEYRILAILSKTFGRFDRSNLAFYR